MSLPVIGRFLGSVVLALALLAGESAQAEDPLTGDQFERLTLGRGFVYSIGGHAYGREDYLPGRRVRWAFEGEACENGYWYEEGAALCFRYESIDTPQCWIFTRDTEGLAARFVSAADDEAVSVRLTPTSVPLDCAQAGLTASLGR